MPTVEYDVSVRFCWKAENKQTAMDQVTSMLLAKGAQDIEVEKMEPYEEQPDNESFSQDPTSIVESVLARVDERMFTSSTIAPLLKKLLGLFPINSPTQVKKALELVDELKQSLIGLNVA